MTIVQTPDTQEELLSRITVDVSMQTQTLSYRGDLTGDGTIGENDAGLAYLLYTGRMDADQSFSVSIRQRLEADVNGDGCVDTTDVQRILTAAWGLS